MGQESPICEGGIDGDQLRGELETGPGLERHFFGGGLRRGRGRNRLRQVSRLISNAINKADRFQVGKAILVSSIVWTGGIAPAFAGSPKAVRDDGTEDLIRGPVYHGAHAGETGPVAVNPPSGEQRKLTCYKLKTQAAPRGGLSYLTDATSDNRYSV